MIIFDEMAAVIMALLLQCGAAHDIGNKGDTGQGNKRENLRFWDRKGNADSFTCDHKVDCCQGE